MRADTPEAAWWEPLVFVGAIAVGFVLLALILQAIHDRRARRGRGRGLPADPPDLEEHGHVISVTVSGRGVLERTALEDAVEEALVAADVGEWDGLGGGTLVQGDAGKQATRYESDFAYQVEDVEKALPVIARALRAAGEPEDTEIRVDGAVRRLGDLGLPPAQGAGKREGGGR